MRQWHGALQVSILANSLMRCSIVDRWMDSSVKSIRGVTLDDGIISRVFKARISIAQRYRCHNAVKMIHVQPRLAVPAPCTRSLLRTLLPVLNHWRRNLEGVDDVSPGLHVHGENSLVLHSTGFCAAFCIACVDGACTKSASWFHAV